MAKITEKFLEHDGTIEEGVSTGEVSVKLNGGTLSKTGNSGIFVANAGITHIQISSTSLGNGLTGGSGVTLSVVAGNYITVNGGGVNVDIASLGGQLAGSGLDYSAGALNIDLSSVGASLAGVGLAYNAGTTALDVDLNNGNGISVSGDTISLGSLTSNWDISGSGNTIIVGAPSLDGHVANKGYVDSVAQGLDVKESCDYITVSDFAIGTNVVATVQNAIDPIGGNPPTLVVGDRILVTAQNTQSQNGIYVVENISGSTVLSRSEDADSNEKVTSGMFTFVEKGDNYHDTGWVLTTEDPIIVGTTALEFTQFSGAGSIDAGAGLVKIGSTLSVGAGSYIIANANDVTVDIDALGSQLAGDGLNYNSGTDTLNINAGNGLTIASDILSVVGGNGIQSLANNIQLGTFSGHWNTYNSSTRYNIKGIADPVDPNDAATKLYVDTVVGGASSYVVGTIELTSTHITNGYIDFSDGGWSTAMPDAETATVDQAVLIVKHGPGQFYGDDFELVESVGSAGYDRLSWDSLALDSVLEVGDKITLQYKI